MLIMPKLGMDITMVMIPGNGMVRSYERVVFGSGCDLTLHVLDYDDDRVVLLQDWMRSS